MNSEKDIVTVEGNFFERKPFQREILKAEKTYSIRALNYANPRSLVHKTSRAMLESYQTQESFGQHSERMLFAIALADSWLGEESVTEKKAFLDIFKLVATGIVEEDRYTTLSGRVRLWGESPRLRAAMFIPDAADGNRFGKFVDKVLDYTQKHQHLRLTEECKAIVSDWSALSLLHTVRTNLGVKKETEKPAEIFVVARNSNQMFSDLGYSSLYFTNFEKGIRRIYLSSDLTSFEHEYAHTQSQGLNRWYMLQLFRGLNEAITEHSVKNPTSYPEQRIFLRRLLAKDSSYKSLIYSAYMGGEKERVKLFQKLISGWGLRGFINFARMSPIDNPHMSGTGKNIFLEPFKANVILGLR